MKFRLAFHASRNSTSSCLKTASWLWAARSSCTALTIRMPAAISSYTKSISANERGE